MSGPNPYPSDSHWPADFQGCTLHGTYLGLDGQPIYPGSVTFTASPVVMLDFTNSITILPRALTVNLDANGHFSIVLPATDDPDISPIDWTYKVTENFVGGRIYSIEAPVGGDVDIVTQSGVPDANGVPIVRGPRGLDGALQTVLEVGPDDAGNADISSVVLLRANNLSDLSSPVAARTALGLGSAAVHPSTDFAAETDLTTLTSTVTALQALFAPGMVFETGSGVVPTGFLACNGQPVSRTVYAALFAAIGTSYGSGNGVSTFNVPDKRGRVGVGEDTSQAEFNHLGLASGEKTHLLSASEMPVHRHSVQSPAAGGGFDLIGDSVVDGAIANRWHLAAGTGTSGVYADLAGGGLAHNNLQPYLTFNYIIKT